MAGIRVTGSGARRNALFSRIGGNQCGLRVPMTVLMWYKLRFSMSLRVARGVYNPEKDRFHFYVSFKPTLDPTAEERGVESSYAVDVAVSVTETGELADIAFLLPELCRSSRCLEYIARTQSVSVVEGRVFVTVPGLSGDSVLETGGTLELDGAGKIIGIEIS